MVRQLSVVCGVVCMVSVLFWGCAKKQVVRPDTVEPVEVEDLVDADISTMDFQNVPQLENIYFEFDKYDLKPAARNTLKENAKFLKSRKDVVVLVEGHCDERGTLEYNMALGQRRADTVKKYYATLGIEASKIQTLSYGEEMPLDLGHSEAAWAKNRRAETKVKRIK